jgi:diadenosine tetraphosphate (Ap4A) HIT family hydrolase
LLDLAKEELTEIMLEAQRLADAMVKLYRPDGVLIYQNNGVGSGQEVPHFHLHVIPRRHGSDWGIGPPHLARFEAEGRPRQFDYTLPTEAKCATVKELRRNLS